MDERHTIDELISILGDMVTEAWTMPLSGGKVVVNRERFLELIDEIKTALPGDLQQARAIVESRNELAAVARRDADAIIRTAEDKARALVHESTILQEAKQAAKELLQNAAANARETIESSENQARQILSSAEARANDIMSNADNKSRELRAATSKFVDDALSRSEEALSNSLGELKHVRAQFHQPATPHRG